MVTRILLVLWMALLAGCASLVPEYDPPGIALESFRALPADGGAPRFEIKLRVTNPNKQALDIAGVAYSVELRGRELLKGVSNEVPTVPAYGSEVFTLDASLQVFQLVWLLADLSREQASSLEYKFAAKIDFEGLVPTQRVEERGTIDLSAKQ